MEFGGDVSGGCVHCHRNSVLTITVDGGREAWRALLRMLTSLLDETRNSACCSSREDVCVRKGLPCTHVLFSTNDNSCDLDGIDGLPFLRAIPAGGKRVSFQKGKFLITASVFTGHSLWCSGYKNPKLKSMHSPNQTEHNRK